MGYVYFALIVSGFFVTVAGSTVVQRSVVLCEEPGVPSIPWDRQRR